MATISTVGYGDMVPQTAIGKLVGGASMLGGILITAISVAVITTSFTEHYQHRCQRAEVARLKHMAQKAQAMAERSAGLHGMTPTSQVSRSNTQDIVAAWEQLEQEVQNHLLRVEAELIDRPLRQRTVDFSSNMALQCLQEQSKALFKQGTVMMSQIMASKSKQLDESQIQH
mmetsp:Transcript_12783/g.30396  ORF Transcript_12783/g.30396 Transcript_12783/m.30396 type:complete len:172 (+) Transcript_12783:1-516(+)